MKPDLIVVLSTGPDDAEPVEMKIERSIWAKLLRIARRSGLTPDEAVAALILQDLRRAA